MNKIPIPKNSLRTVFKVLVVSFFLLFLAVPVRNYSEKIKEAKRLEKEERKTIGSVETNNLHVKEIQQILNNLRFYSGPADGFINKEVRAAIKNFQSHQNIASTGMVDSKTLTELSKQDFVLKQLKNSPLSVFFPVQTRASVEDSQEFLTKSAVDSWWAIKNKIKETGNPEKDRILKIQTALKKEGFYKGNIDGKSGPQTIKAVKDFQKSRNLNPDGVVGPKTWGALQTVL